MLTIIEISIFSACLSFFLDFCFRDGNIFQKWFEFLFKRYYKGNLWYDLSQMNEKQLKSEGFDNFKEYAYDMLSKDWFWFKPLGYCIVCSNVWVTAFICFLCFMNPVQMLFCIVLSNFLVRYFYDRLL